MLQIVEPLTFVFGAINVCVLSLPAGLVLLPVALVDVAVCVPELTLAVGLVVDPVAFVLGTVRPDLGPVAVPLT